MAWCCYVDQHPLPSSSAQKLSLEQGPLSKRQQCALHPTGETNEGVRGKKKKEEGEKKKGWKCQRLVLFNERGNSQS